jgi:hypothetical protein
VTERCPVHNLLKNAGVRFRETWDLVPPDGSAAKAGKKSGIKK